MKLLTVISAGLVLAAASAQAQSPLAGPRYTGVSDFSGPYAAMPPGAGPGYGPSYGPNDGPRLLPAHEVYTVLRDNGFLPLGSPRQRGVFYTISVTDRRGDDGRLVIDARNGRIVQFVPAYRSRPGYGGGPDVAYGPPGRMPPAGPAPFADEMRPPAPVPKLASRAPSAVPLPKAEPSGEIKPAEAKPLAEKPAPAQGQQSAANQVKPAEAVPASPAPAPVEAKPSAPQQPEILPTQEMPKVQGLE